MNAFPEMCQGECTKEVKVLSCIIMKQDIRIYQPIANADYTLEKVDILPHKLNDYCNQNDM